MELYQAFMIAERQNRISKNKQKINEILLEFKKMKEKYIGVVFKIDELKKEYLKIEKQLDLLNQDYITYTDENFIYDKSESIQLLSENIEFKEEQIQFAGCLKKANDKKLPMFLIGLMYFYKYKNCVEKEENCSKTCFIKVFHSYLKQYKVLKRTGLELNETNITSLISKYKTQKQGMIIELDKLMCQLDQRKNCIRKYSENKELMKNRTKEILSEIEKLSLSFDYKTYEQRKNEYNRLLKENDIYQAQIDSLISLNNSQQELENNKIIKFQICA